MLTQQLVSENNNALKKVSFSELTVRLPARLVLHYRNFLKIWILARAVDIQGCGKAEFSIGWASSILQRSRTTIRRYLSQAYKQGIIRHYKTTGDTVVIYYSALKVIALRAGMEELGEFIDIEIEEIVNQGIHATEAIALGLQREALHIAKAGGFDGSAEARNNPKEFHQTRSDCRKKAKEFDWLKPEDFWITTTANEPTVRITGKGVLMANERFTFVNEKVGIFGGSQEAIAQRRGVSVRTVQRHLSNSYRLLPSAARGSRAGLQKIHKRQLAQRLPKIQYLAISLSKSEGLRVLDEDGKHLVVGDRLYLCRTNIYYPNQQLISARYRRQSYKQYLLKIRPAPEFKSY